MKLRVSGVNDGGLLGHLVGIQVREGEKIARAPDTPIVLEHQAIELPCVFCIYQKWQLDDRRTCSHHPTRGLEPHQLTRKASVRYAAPLRQAFLPISHLRKGTEGHYYSLDELRAEYGGRALEVGVVEVDRRAKKFLVSQLQAADNNAIRAVKCTLASPLSPADAALLGAHARWRSPVIRVGAAPAAVHDVAP